MNKKQNKKQKTKNKKQTKQKTKKKKQKTKKKKKKTTPQIPEANFLTTLEQQRKISTLLENQSNSKEINFKEDGDYTKKEYS